MKKSIFNTFLVMGFSLVTRCLAFGFKVFMSRTLGAEALGLFGMGMAMFGMLTMLPSSGIPLSVSRHVAELNAKGKRTHGIVSAGLVLSIVVNIATVGIFFAFKAGLLSLFADARAEKVILIMLPATFSTCIYNVLRAYFMGRKHYIAYSVTETVEEVVNIVVVVVLLYAGIASFSGGETLAIAFLVGDVFCLLLIVVLYFCMGGRLGKPRQMGPLVRSSTPITLMRLFTSLAATFTAIILPNRMVASGMGVAQSTALYGEAVGMAYPLLFAPLAITSSLSVVLLPELARLATMQDKGEIARKIDTASLFILLITTYFFVIYAVLGHDLGVMIFGSEHAGDFVSFAAGMVMPLCLCQLTNTAMNSLAMELRCFAYSMIGLVVMALCLWFLPALIGVYALGVAQTAFFLVSVVLNTITLSKKGYTHLNYTKPYLKVAIGSAAIAAICIWWRRQFVAESLLQTILIGVVATLLYALLVIGTKALDIKAVWHMVIYKNKAPEA